MHSAETFAGHVIEGPVVSRTVTVKVHVAVFGGAALSLAVHVTVVVPNGKVVPDAGAQLTVGPESQAPVATGLV